MREVTFPLKLFCCYAPGDALLSDELNKHLSELEREGLITIWDERKINPGDDRKQVYYSQLDDANIILLFISADFIRSDDCHNDLQQALKSYEQNQTLRWTHLSRQEEGQL